MEAIIQLFDMFFSVLLIVGWLSIALVIGGVTVLIVRLIEITRS